MRLAEEAMQSFRERERAASLETMLVEAQTSIDQTAPLFLHPCQIGIGISRIQRAKTMPRLV
jgi:hypothetical protein